jgi:hypothetical protein
MRPFFFWLFQVFFFCSVLGLIAGDYLILSREGLPARELRVVHNIPVLSAYASVIVAGVSTTIVALVTSRIGDVVKFFLETVLPQAPSLPQH